MMLMSLMMLSMVFVMITMAGESTKRILEVLSEKSTLTDPENPVYEVPDGSVDFDGVSFRYSAKAERMALSNIDLHIKSGETIGIIGGTGSAKSTLVNLISRLYDVTEGSVRVGGRDVREYDIEALRSNVAVVLQKNQLFSGTIKENLRWGNKDATDEELVHVCKLAQADDFIRSFPDGYDTYIEQGGTNVLRRPETAPVHRPRAAQKAEDTHTRRLHLGGGHQDRRRHPPRAARVHARDDEDHHRPAHRLRRGRGPHRGNGRRLHHGRRLPRRAHGLQRGLPRDLHLAEQGRCRRMKNAKGSGAVVRRLLRTIREFYPVMLPITIVCIIINAVVSSIPSIFMQNIIEVIEVSWQSGDWAAARGTVIRLVATLAGFYAVSLVAGLIFNQLMAIITQGTLKKLRCKMFDKMQCCPSSTSTRTATATS